jgi:hypothetical protein
VSAHPLSHFPCCIHPSSSFLVLFSTCTSLPFDYTSAIPLNKVCFNHLPRSTGYFLRKAGKGRRHWVHSARRTLPIVCLYSHLSAACGVGGSLWIGNLSNPSCHSLPAKLAANILSCAFPHGPLTPRYSDIITYRAFFNIEKWVIEIFW